jgi:pimeloyl-ACP methyl ester carboxylesterase
LPGIEGGHGKTVVFLHGYPLSHEIWEPQLTLLSAGHRLVMLDLPGYGLAQDRTPPETLGGFASAVHDAIAVRSPGPVVVVGHSFGGYIALELVRQHPEQFEALVLTDTRSSADSAEVRAKRLATAERLADPTQGLDIDETVRGLLTPETWEAQGPIVQRLRGIVLAVPPSTIIASLKAIAGRADLTPVLPTITVPTLVVWGEDDQLIPPEQSQSMVGRIPGAVGVEIPQAGHLPFLETPHSFARPVVDFLGRLAPP